jgi:hypothetical protein
MLLAERSDLKAWKLRVKRRLGPAPYRGPSVTPEPVNQGLTASHSQSAESIPMPEIQPPKAKLPTANGGDRIWKDRNMDQDQREVDPQPITNSQRRTVQVENVAPHLPRVPYQPIIDDKRRPVQVEHVAPHTPRVHHQPINDDKRRPVQVEHVRSNSQTQQGEPRPAGNSEKNDNLPAANPPDLRTV